MNKFSRTFFHLFYNYFSEAFSMDVCAHNTAPHLIDFSWNGLYLETTWHSHKQHYPRGMVGRRNATEQRITTRNNMFLL